MSAMSQQAMSCGPETTGTCETCSCTRVQPATEATGLLLATGVDHTSTTLRTLAIRRGTPLSVRGTGLLRMDGDAAVVREFLIAAAAHLTSVEADEVRVLGLGGSADQGADGRPDGHEAVEGSLLARALRAPTLAAEAARAHHADLLPLLDDERMAFHSVFQPIVRLDDPTVVVGHEALLRAEHPDGRPVMPAELFGAADAAGWTHLLDRVGRTTALREASGWLGDDLLFINFVPTSIYRPEVCLRTTERAAADAGVRLDQIVFEVVEGQDLPDLAHLENVFAYYRSRRCKVALDDLGSGYSSLNRLVALKPDLVKLDRELVQSLPGRTAGAVVEAVVQIVRSYGGVVLAEGIETPQQAEAARALGAHLGQGWLFGRPVRRAVPAPREPAPDLGAAGLTTGAPPAPDVTAAAPPVPGPPATAARVPAVPDDVITAAVARAAAGMSVVDMRAPGQPVVLANDALCALSGYEQAELLGRNMRMLQGPRTDRHAVEAIRAALAAGRAHQSVLRNYRKDGTVWWNELHLWPVPAEDGGPPPYFVGYQHDVSDRVEAEERLRRRAGHDDLTGVLSRATLFERLEEAVAEATAHERAVVVLYLDLDGFKQVNDTFGHAVGDHVLVQVAERLHGALRGADLLARLGGDEFVAVLGDLPVAAADTVAAEVAARMLSGLEEPFDTGAVPVRLGGSLGAATYPTDATSVDRLVAEADAAMYRAKRAGRGSVRTARER